MVGTCMPKTKINAKKQNILFYDNFFAIRIHNGKMLACSVFESGHGDNCSILLKK